MQLKVTAELYSGFASSDPWSPSLDGILAYQYMKEKLGPDAFALSSHRSDRQQIVYGLPLGVEEYDGTWWYQCSFPEYDSKAEVTRYYHRRFDARQAEKYWKVPGKSGKVMVAAGPYKNARLQIKHHITPCVSWYCIGDKVEIERLLSKVTHIGAKFGSGFGRVRNWTVEECECEEKARYWRPLPASFADEHGITGTELYHGIRPPARHPDNQMLCVMP